MRNGKRRSFDRALRRVTGTLTAYLRREGRLWLWFAAAAAGVLAKGFFDAMQTGRPCRPSWVQALMALVITMVTFQAIFQRCQDLQADTPLLVQLCLAFQSGFFWQTLFDALK
jgi:L-asparagine transporter-like permease